jgi:hypothetical protein
MPLFACAVIVFARTVGVGVVELNPCELVVAPHDPLDQVAQRAGVELRAEVELLHPRGGRARVHDPDVVVAVVADPDPQAGAVDEVAVEVERDTGATDDDAVAGAVD